MQNFSFRRYGQLITLALLPLTLLACSQESPVATPEVSLAPSSAVIYHNGALITMAGDAPSVAEALVEDEGKIVFVGSLDDARAEAGTQAAEFDLQGATLMPGLIEPHLHPSLAAMMLRNEIIAPYDWKLPSGVKPGVSGEANYRARITESIKSNALPDEIYFIWGYHQLWHGELSRDLLNEIDHNPRMRQAVALTLGASGQQNRAHAGGLTDHHGGDVWLDKLHRVVDCQARCHHATRTVDVDIDVLVRVF